ncbi:arylsulfatase [Paracoccus saliphilus]|uniref:Arylsulfatase n=1 Tax=Paracoccus saliphilus TaxID=405559 RepID=A0AA45W5Q0_9RHOB|nr:arylsulfatase [Paracoccus saliphilus]WCR05587.1 arylsulfatase [Paracoccus saliphilus]SIS95936.1 arylsulfatase [Paracoccus saliphilus]
MNQPNIVLILNDDMGYSDIGCYGGEVETPNLDRLAQNGLRYSQFYNTARCSPSRASLMTGLHPHQTGIGVLTYSIGPEGYVGNLVDECITIPELLKSRGYRTYMSGKWHVAADLEKPNGAWPTERGFDEFYGTVIGAGSFYHPNTLTRGLENVEHEAVGNPEFFYTDAISDQAADYVRGHKAAHADQPFFMYVAYTAPHWPLHAHDEDIARYKGRFDAGWDRLREERLDRLVRAGLIDASWQLTDRDPSQPPFEEAGNKEWLCRLMEVYAAQIDRMDQGIGRILEALEQNGQMDNTIIVFLSDNGGCAEDIPEDVDPRQLVEDLKIAQYRTRDGRPVTIGNDPSIMPGGEDTYQSYGIPWANLSNSPFRLYKHFTHEGGIATPLIVHWPEEVEAGGIRHVPGQLPDIMATILDITGAEYPAARDGHAIPPCEGVSLRPSFRQDVTREEPLFWEHEGNAAMRDGKWKLVRRYPGPWELYDMEADRTEMHDMAGQHPDRVERMAAGWQEWADRCGVIPREKILEIMKAQGVEAFWEEDA